MITNLSLWLVTMAVALIAAPLVLPGLGGEFKGSDDQATEAILAVSPSYQPWFRPLWNPPNGEIASLLFAVQAALGAGVLGYIIGRRRSSPPRGDDVSD